MPTQLSPSGCSPSTLNQSCSHQKNCLQNLMKLHKNTPEPFIFFMAGSLSATANIHIRQLSLFGMITRLPDNILHVFAHSKLASDPDSSSSWFIQIQHLCTKYSLPSPLSLLTNPPTKSTYKNLIKKKLVDFWQQELRDETKT